MNFWLLITQQISSMFALCLPKAPYLCLPMSRRLRESSEYAFVWTASSRDLRSPCVSTHAKLKFWVISHSNGAHTRHTHFSKVREASPAADTESTCCCWSVR